MMKRTIICISRQYGSGGREIGEAVAKKLGIPCYDKCLIQKAAQEAGLSETAVAEYDEKGEDFGIAVSGNPFADTAPPLPYWRLMQMIVRSIFFRSCLTFFLLTAPIVAEK